MEDLSIEVKLDGIDELKKLLNEALEQVEQLEITLKKIKEVRIRVDSKSKLG